jgi:tetratricopeptide (TPR) repeat protein
MKEITMRWLPRCVLLGSLATAPLLVLAPSRASAQPAPKVDKAKANAARQYVEAGLAAQATGDHDTAITFYQKAYDVMPHPVLWFNMAQAHRLAGRVEQALGLYAKYLAADANGPQASTARALVADIEARKVQEARAAQEARDAEQARRVEAARKVVAERAAADARRAEEVRKAEAARRAAANPSGEGHVAPTPDPKPVADPLPATAATHPEVSSDAGPDQSAGRALRRYGLGVGAVGVASLVVGVGFGLHASSLSSELSRPGAAYDPGKVDAGESANRVAIIGVVGGTVAVAVGAALYWRGWARGKDAERVTLAPMLSDQIAGLVVAGVWP